MKLETWKPKPNFLDKFGFIFSEFKYILAVLLMAFLVLGSIKLGKVINDYLYLQATRNAYMASIADQLIDESLLRPFRNWKIENLNNIQSAAAISWAVDKDDGKALFEKNADKIMPIASLSKLITASVALKNYDLGQKTTITPNIIRTESDTGMFRQGEEFNVEELLYSMLLESSNDAARAVASIMGEKQFVGLMNEEVKKMGLSHTYFIDPIGLDPDSPRQGYNYSTARDLAKMGQYLFEESKQDPKIAKLFEITRAKEHNVFMANGVFHHQAINTNEILTDFPEIIGTKTGQTPLAGQCLFMILPQPKEGGYLVDVVLGSNDRFQEMKKIINWVNIAYLW